MRLPGRSRLRCSICEAAAVPRLSEQVELSRLRKNLPRGSDGNSVAGVSTKTSLPGLFCRRFRFLRLGEKLDEIAQILFRQHLAQLLGHAGQTSLACLDVGFLDRKQS